MNCEEVFYIFDYFEEIVLVDVVNVLILKMVDVICVEIGDVFLFVFLVMGGVVVFIGMLLLYFDFLFEFDYIYLICYCNMMQGSLEMYWCVVLCELVKDCIVFVFDDIFDEGEMMVVICDCIFDMGVQCFMLVVLCEKMFVKVKLLYLDFCGFLVLDCYVFGCGMDVKGYWCNLLMICVLIVNV